MCHSMTEPELQGQHRISQIYLKQFGFKREENGAFQSGKNF